MGALLHIRKAVLGLSQVEMAKVAGVTQATVSRWEAGLSEPDRGEMQRIREAAAARGKAWDDSWFFVPLASSSSDRRATV